MRILHKNTSSSPAERRGSTLVVVLLVVLVVAGMTSALLQVGLSSRREQAKRLDDDRAFYLAEAGLVEARRNLEEGGAGALGALDAPVRFGDGLLWVDVADEGKGRTSLTSYAMCGSGRAALELVVVQTGGALFPAGMLANIGIDFGPNAFMDSYDSALGNYNSQTGPGGFALENADLLCNDGATFGSGAEIHGGVHAGPGDTLDFGSGAQVSGSTLPMEEEFAFPPGEPPSVPPGPDHVSAGAKETLGPGDIGLSSLLIDKKAELTIEGPATVVIDGDFNMKSGTLNVDASGGPVEIHVTGNVYFQPFTEVNTSGNGATDVGLYLQGDRDQLAEFQAKSAFNGTIYGPNATLVVGPHFEVFGAVAANYIELENKSILHYDEALGNAFIQEDKITDTSWRTVAFPAIEYAAKLGDPFRLLGVDKDALLTPAEALAP
jgi:hypothetical protein